MKSGMNRPLMMWLAVFILVAPGNSACSSTGYSVPKTVAQDSNLPRLELNGALLHAETFGSPDNPVVIVLHGGAGWDYRYLLPIQALSDEFFVIFYDQRGSGLSARVPDEQLSYEIMLKDLDAIVDHYGRGRKVSLIGHSWGGMLGSGYIGRYPNKVAGAVIAASGPLTEEIEQLPSFHFSFGAGFVVHVTWEWFASRFQSGPDEDAQEDYFYYRMFATYEGEGHPFAGYHCGNTVAAGDVTVWRFGSRAMNQVTATYDGSDGNPRVDFTEGVEAFEQEVLFLAGACDSILTPELQRQQMQYFPNTRLVVIQNAGHDVFTEQPAASLVPVRSYLRSSTRTK